VACCFRYCAAEAHFDTKTAKRDLRRYQRRGPDDTTMLILDELRRRPLQKADLLDVGAGIGVVSLELAGSGIASATIVEASPAYLEIARQGLTVKYGTDAARFVLGDFVAIAPSLSDADVVTLDRVVCCYPDPEALLAAAATRGRRLIVFTYPRDRWYVRVFIAVENFWRRLKGNPFRAFVHSPHEMGAVLEAAGFARAARQGTPVWMVDLYQR